jgi:hypothetical protein
VYGEVPPLNEVVVESVDDCPTTIVVGDAVMVGRDITATESAFDATVAGTPALSVT